MTLHPFLSPLLGVIAVLALTGSSLAEPPDATDPVALETANDDLSEAEELEDGELFGDPDEGAEMAEALCSRCHAIGRTGESPVADAPLFRSLAARWPLSYLEEALAEGIMVGHPLVEMPAFQFSPTEIAHLLAYLDSIQEGDAARDDDGRELETQELDTEG